MPLRPTNTFLSPFKFNNAGPPPHDMSFQIFHRELTTVGGNYLGTNLRQLIKSGDLLPAQPVSG